MLHFHVFLDCTFGALGKYCCGFLNTQYKEFYAVCHIQFPSKKYFKVSDKSPSSFSSSILHDSTRPHTEKGENHLDLTSMIKMSPTARLDPYKNPLRETVQADVSLVCDV